uniref:Uncharacterized protein n=1 Tax=Cacopsylla melanoneura TaxID=428564 RepID=A0A8D8YWU7_9HEMI
MTTHISVRIQNYKVYTCVNDKLRVYLVTYTTQFGRVLMTSYISLPIIQNYTVYTCVNDKLYHIHNYVYTCVKMTSYISLPIHNYVYTCVKMTSYNLVTYTQLCLHVCSKQR